MFQRNHTKTFSPGCRRLMSMALWVCLGATAQAHFLFLKSVDVAPNWDALLVFSESTQVPGQRLPERIAPSPVWLRTGRQERRQLELARQERDGEPLLTAPMTHKGPCALESHCDYGLYHAFRLT